jgi:teichuronic acid biosynthesis glycosyltransferase TuaG
MTNDLISIITPTYNSEEYIAFTIESILNQSYKNWELLITDDCSSDNTVSIINSFISKDDRIHLYQFDNNLGSAFARNNSIKLSKGNFIAFCDSDDIWDKTKLKKQVYFMKKNNISFSFTGYEIINKLGDSIGKTIDSAHKGSFSYKEMLSKKATLGCSTVILKKSSFNGLLVMPEIRTGQDYALWLKLLKNTNHQAYVLSEILSKYRISPNSISRNKFKKAKRQWFIYRQFENLNTFKTIYYFCFYAFRAVFKTS